MAQILVVEDEPGIVIVLEEILTDAGYGVITASNGKEGLQMIKNSMKPDLCIVDLFMPEMGGRDFIANIHSDPELGSIPIILLTDSVPTVKDFPPGGSYREIICKPFDIDDVLTKVGQVLQSRQWESESRIDQMAGNRLH
jgi:CheY-like chemotaxis protein